MNTKRSNPRSEKGLMFVGNPEALTPTMKQLGGQGVSGAPGESDSGGTCRYQPKR
jgi:hypothetical protein